MRRFLGFEDSDGISGFGDGVWYEFATIFISRIQNLLPNTQKTLNYPIFMENSRFFVALHDNNTAQILI